MAGERKTVAGAKKSPTPKRASLKRAAQSAAVAKKPVAKKAAVAKQPVAKNAAVAKEAAPAQRAAPPKVAATAGAPELSIVIPVYNEEAILEGALRKLVTEVRSLERSFEILVAANGCTDMTVSIATELQHELPELRLLLCPTPNYGAAMKLGVQEARGRYVLCDEIDLCDVGFYRRALRRLDGDECEMVVGSKAMPGSRDRRPFSRRAATKVINQLLWATLGFQGTDTHGLKAFDRSALMPVLESCIIDKDLFASELVIRTGRAGLRIQEIPIELEEQRSPPINLLKRVPRVFRDLGRLVVAIRFTEAHR